jgi:hypothetical protein
MTTYGVSGDHHREVGRKMREIKRLLRQPGGSPLDPEVVLRRLELIIERVPTAAPAGSCTPKQAAAIMGPAFHGMDAVKRHLELPWQYPYEVTQREVVPFSEQALEACSETHVLIAAARLSVMNVRAVAPEAFYFTKLWYADEEFARKKAKASWYLIRKNAVPGSTSKTWAEQQAAMPENEFTPRMAELVQAVIVHYLETGERLFSSHYVRTNDVDSGGRRLSLGRFASRGVRMHSRGDFRDYYIGLAGAQKSSWTRGAR